MNYVPIDPFDPVYNTEPACVAGLTLFSEKMSSSTNSGAEAGLEVGNCCFAHVKGNPWWPAVIIKKIGLEKKKRFCVSFFGTDEAAWLPSQHESFRRNHSRN